MSCSSVVEIIGGLRRQRQYIKKVQGLNVRSAGTEPSE